MKSKNIFTLVIIILLFGFIITACNNNKGEIKQSQQTSNTVTPISSNANNPEQPIISIQQLSTHNKESDCWISYQGKVYDITAFIPNHKEYTTILVPLCGKSSEFEQAFTNKHGTSKVEVLTSQGVYKGTLE